MKQIICKQCGASDFLDVTGYRICRYCNTRYQLFSEDVTPMNAKIELIDDVKVLLEKCKRDPANAKKYANLILDIDPTNCEAQKYL